MLFSCCHFVDLIRALSHCYYSKHKSKYCCFRLTVARVRTVPFTSWLSTLIDCSCSHLIRTLSVFHSFGFHKLVVGLACQSRNCLHAIAYQSQLVRSLYQTYVAAFMCYFCKCFKIFLLLLGLLLRHYDESIHYTVLQEFFQSLEQQPVYSSLKKLPLNQYRTQNVFILNPFHSFIFQHWRLYLKKCHVKQKST